MNRQYLHDIIGAIIEGHLKSPFVANDLKVYYTDGDLSVYAGDSLVLDGSMKSGGVVGNLGDDELTAGENTILSDLIAVMGSEAFPRSKLRSIVDDYSSRYDYRSVLASLYEYVDDNDLKDVDSNTISKWLAARDNPLIVININRNRWNDRLLSDIKKWIERNRNDE